MKEAKLIIYIIDFYTYNRDILVFYIDALLHIIILRGTAVHMMMIERREYIERINITLIKICIEALI